jgi:two-component system, oxyanion-binding sensor
MSTIIRIGLLRLTDSAPVVVARARGLFEALDIEPILSVEPSWANLADKLSFGLLDAAVMLPPLTLAMAAGLRGPSAKLIVPMGISQGGNTIVLGGEGARLDAGKPPGCRLVAWLRRQNARPRFAVVHRFSTHNLLLRYWLALSGIDPDRDIETVVVPPSEVVAALTSGQIAGFCAGAPWGVAAEQAGAGSVLMGTSDIWPFHPEKCLTVRADWAAEQPEAATNLIRAVMRAQAICDRADEADAVVTALARSDGLALPADAVRTALPGGGGQEQIHFHGSGAGYPAPPHAIWFLRQMRRWGWLDRGTDLTAIAEEVYRPDLYARAARVEDLFRGPGESIEARLPEVMSVPFDHS